MKALLDLFKQVTQEEEFDERQYYHEDLVEMDKMIGEEK